MVFALIDRRFNDFFSNQLVRQACKRIMKRLKSDRLFLFLIIVIFLIADSFP
ncbi:hypothetical protein NBRC111894_899 [Sporolactobacillus inulinus]|uniref:Uncharacterized protein n=1 Tax=Sporolactobacillus inulinus TaxID=2078 RepID=A0A4Y1Z8N9_9BACL|nr:hypothetical protein NBRC111894_899 [Sporolactobacillus inulinus]